MNSINQVTQRRWVIYVTGLHVLHNPLLNMCVHWHTVLQVYGHFLLIGSVTSCNLWYIRILVGLLHAFEPYLVFLIFFFRKSAFLFHNLIFLEHCLKASENPAPVLCSVENWLKNAPNIFFHFDTLNILTLIKTLMCFSKQSFNKIQVS